MKKTKFVFKKKLGLFILVAVTVVGGVFIPFSDNSVTVHAAEKKTGWKKEKNIWKYYKNGKAYTGWHWMTSKEGEKTPHFSYFGPDGRLRTGWQSMGTKNNPDGKNAQHMSYFGPNGWLRTGWQSMGTKNNPDGKNEQHMSYFGSNGWLRTGWQSMGTKNNPDGKNAQHMSYFGPNGWLRTGWQSMGTKKNPDGKNVQHMSYFGLNGWLGTGWQEMGNGTSNPDGNKIKHTSYFGDNGWLRTGLSLIDEKQYIFSKNYNGKTDAGWLLYDYDKDESYSYTWDTGGLNYVRAVAHRGYNDGIPENSLAAFREAKKRGFEYVEADVVVTKDGVYVLSHDGTINRCARTEEGDLIKSTVIINETDYEELLKYDFGIYKSSEFKGTKIASFEDFLELCKKLKLKAYIHLKEYVDFDENNVREIENLVKEHDMENEVTWTSFSSDLLNYVTLPKTRKGYLIYGPISQEKINTVVEMKKQGHDAYLSVGYRYSPTDEEVKMCVKNKIPIQCWTINSLDDMKKMNSYISGFTSDYVNAVKMYEN